MKLKRYNQMNEELFGLNPKHGNDIGGISTEKYNEIKDFISNLVQKLKIHTITDEEKVLSEIFYMMVTKEKDNLDYDTYYHDRLSFIKENKYPKRTTEEKSNFHKLVWWLQGKYVWDYVEPVGPDKVNFYWDENKQLFCLNDDLTTEGFPPEELRKTLEEKGIKIDKG